MRDRRWIQWTSNGESVMTGVTTIDYSFAIDFNGTICLSKEGRIWLSGPNPQLMDISLASLKSIELCRFTLAEDLASSFDFVTNANFCITKVRCDVFYLGSNFSPVALLLGVLWKNFSTYYSDFVVVVPKGPSQNQELLVLGAVQTYRNREHVLKSFQSNLTKRNHQAYSNEGT